MNCTQCKANLIHTNASGETVVRNKGLVLKSEGLTAICPKCGADVALSQTITKAIQSSAAILFFKKS